MSRCDTDAGLASLLSSIPPGHVASSVMGDDHIITEPLYPAEVQRMLNATVTREASFRAARACARDAFQQLGFPGRPPLSAPFREPLRWPVGFTGSLTHSRGVAAAAVARTAVLAGLGIDVERHRCLSTQVEQQVLDQEEKAVLRGFGRLGPYLAPLIAFSLKESTFKAVCTAHNLRPTLKDMRIHGASHSDALTVEVGSSTDSITVDARFGWFRDTVVTAAWIAADP